MKKEITGTHELEMLSFDWTLQKPELVLTFSTLCCASGTCDDFISQIEMHLEDITQIPVHYDSKNPFDIQRTFGSLRIM